MGMKKWIALCLLLLCMMTVQVFAEGSWSQINARMERPENWTRIVTDPSAFNLGSDTPYDGNSDLSVRNWGTYPSIDGSTVCVPMAMEFAREWLDLPEEDLTGFVNFSTTPVAYERLTMGDANPLVTILSQNAMMDDTRPVDMVLGTGPNLDEREALKAAGKTVEMVPVCYDAFIFMVNRMNPVDSLQADQIRDIYSGDMTYVYDVPDADGEVRSPVELEEYEKYLDYIDFVPYITSWSEVGGDGGTIKAYQRPHGSGSQTAMEELVMRDRPLMTVEENYIAGGMAEAVSRIGNFGTGRDAIGYSYLYYVNALYLDENIKVIAIDGIEPTADNLRSGAYPFTVCYYAVYEEGNETARLFVDWMVSDEGQACIAQAGYISLR